MVELTHFERFRKLVSDRMRSLQEQDGQLVYRVDRDRRIADPQLLARIFNETSTLNCYNLDGNRAAGVMVREAGVIKVSEPRDPNPAVKPPQQNFPVVYNLFSNDILTFLLRLQYFFIYSTTNLCTLLIFNRLQNVLYSFARLHTQRILIQYCTIRILVHSSIALFLQMGPPGNRTASMSRIFSNPQLRRLFRSRPQKSTDSMWTDCWQHYYFSLTLNT